MMHKANQNKWSKVFSYQFIKCIKAHPHDIVTINNKFLYIFCLAIPLFWKAGK